MSCLSTRLSSTSPRITCRTHTVAKDFQVDDTVLTAFKQYLTSEQIPFTDQDLPPVLDWLKANIKSDLFTSQFGQTEGLKIKAMWDPMINSAIGYLPQAEALEQKAKQTDVQRASASLHSNQ